MTKRWLDRTSEALSGIAAEEGRAPEARLRDWFQGLFDAKRRKAGHDPELFATYSVLTDENGAVVGEHIDDLTAQLTRIVEAGVAAGAFTSADPAATARALFHATGRFHDPCHAREWERPDVQAEFDAVLDLLLRGLRS